METFYHDAVLRCVKIFNVGLVTAPFAICWLVYYADRTASPYYARGNWLVIALFLAIYTVCGRIYEGFLISLSRISEMIYSQGLAALIANLLMYVVTWLLSKHLPAVWPLALSFAGQLALAAAWSYLAHQWYFHTFPPKRTVIIYDIRQGMERLISEYGLTKKFWIVGTASVEECLEQNMLLLEGAEVVFLCGVCGRERDMLLKECVGRGRMAYVLPQIGDVLMQGARQVHMFHLPMLRVGRYSPAPEYLLAKRLFDLTAAAVLLVLASPIMLLTALAVKLTDGGPVFYKQQRLTKNGKVFNVLKFRSMRQDAEQDGVARLSTGDRDERVTPVGRMIRKVRIDELPQLFNILSGSMSVVGPRPERPELAAQYEQTLPEFHLRLQAKAGLTGYAQVYGKYNTTPYDKLQMDLMYIANPSMVEDLKIVFATVKTIFSPASTEGVEVETAMGIEEKTNV